MSDLKGRRPLRELARGDGTSSETVRAEPAMTIAPESAAAPEAVAAPEAPPPVAPKPGAPPAAPAVDASWAALTEIQAALVHGFEEMADEMTGLTRSNVTAASDAAIALLGARTFAEAVEINAGLARRGIDAMTDGSAKMLEISVKAMTETSRPILSRLTEAWGRAIAI